MYRHYEADIWGHQKKGRKLSFPRAPIEVKSGQRNKQEKGKRVAKYHAIAQAISEKERHYRLINDIWKK